MKKIVSSILVLLSVLMVVACNHPVKVDEYTVTFDASGGTDILPILVNKDGFATKPDNPQRDGFIFKYWYLETNTLEFLFESTPITADIKLFAYWQTDPNAVFYTVTFDTQGGGLIDSQEVYASSLAKLPKDPIKEGFDFIGWFIDAETKKVFTFTAKITSAITLYAGWELKTDTVAYTITYDTLGGSTISNQIIIEGAKTNKPANPTLTGYLFVGWTLNNLGTGDAFDFNTPITQNITLYAIWEEEIILSSEEKLALTIAEIEADLVFNKHELNLPTSSTYATYITWWTDSPYISTNGIVLSVANDVNLKAQVRASLVIGGVVQQHFFEVDLNNFDNIDLVVATTIPFVNMTTEYEVADNDHVEIYYEEDGSVPYIKVKKFLDLLEGFIDPYYNLTYEYLEPEVLQISYDYYSLEEDYTYHLVNIINANDNTISTNDQGFYSAYVYSTATNYSRNIFYPSPLEGEELYEGESYREGNLVTYDLGKYAIDIVTYEDEVVLPFSLANQFYAGSSYYNVYFNHDKLIGAYAVPETSSDEYKALKVSSVKGQLLPGDMLSMTYNTLAFYMDHFYGLKDIMEVETYYDVLVTYRDNLLNKTANTVDRAIFNFIINSLAEAHTSYGFSSFYATNNGPTINNYTQFKDRTLSLYVDGLIPTNSAIAAKWGNHDARKDYWYLNQEQSAVVVTLDDFYTSDIVEDVIYDQTKINKILDEEVLIPEIVGGNKYLYYDNSEIEYHVAEIIVKGIDKSYVTTYKEALVDYGFNLGTTTKYYQKEFNGTNYVVVVDFDDTYNFFYVGITANYAKRANIGRLDNILNADSAIRLELILEKIVSLNPNLENITLDITYNTGGNVGALYRIIGFITGDVFYVTNMNLLTNSANTSAVYIDGVSKVGHDLTWSLLASRASYSAANSLVTIFKSNNLGIVMGTISGGGAASITPILLPNGTTFTMSSNSLSAYRTGLGTELDPYEYHDNEFGLEPDYLVEPTNFYNQAILLEILNN